MIFQKKTPWGLTTLTSDSASVHLLIKMPGYNFLSSEDPAPYTFLRQALSAFPRKLNVLMCVNFRVLPAWFSQNWKEDALDGHFLTGHFIWSSQCPRGMFISSLVSKQKSKWRPELVLGCAGFLSTPGPLHMLVLSLKCCPSTPLLSCHLHLLMSRLSITPQGDLLKSCRSCLITFIIVTHPSFQSSSHGVQVYLWLSD